jgi:hypothetical protein
VDVGEDQFPVLVIPDGLHESVGDADGNVEVGDGVFADLGGDELFHIRVVHAHDAHIGAAALVPPWATSPKAWS